MFLMTSYVNHQLNSETILREALEILQSSVEISQGKIASDITRVRRMVGTEWPDSDALRKPGDLYSVENFADIR